MSDVADAIGGDEIEVRPGEFVGAVTVATHMLGSVQDLDSRGRTSTSESVGWCSGDQVTNRVSDGWTARLVGIGPFAGDQVTVPGQQYRRGDDPMAT
jgi:hypothetical protein